jgi:hypothetical protein
MIKIGKLYRNIGKNKYYFVLKIEKSKWSPENRCDEIHCLHKNKYCHYNRELFEDCVEEIC